MPPPKFLQANLNRSPASRDVFLHTMAERGCVLGVAAELGRVPRNHPSWAVSRCGLVAITWRRTDKPVACSRVEASDGFVMAKWGHVYVAGVYVSPNVCVAAFEEVLEDLRVVLERFLPCQVIVAGDFNAMSVLWGSPATDRRGRILEEWAAGLGLVVLNTGHVQTCVRRQGGSSSI
ncbi:uncharacterized protein LOC112453242 [Temnothorax curvispinosus]|uniref:Uncharacterized protein LOC112453242 n=1 Tax=Temnothorax curvispinosus TaxID=300111 RepID=A0A6J1PJ29_9HYME|nr:uncharacterized protein LOC112453242 [Temnothorax curvispinosus]